MTVELTFAQKENIGLRYVLDALQPCSPYGREQLRDLQIMGPGQRCEIQRQLHNVAALQRDGQCSKTLQQLLRSFMGLKMVRATAKKCLKADLNAIELFELKRFLLQSAEMLPLFTQLQTALDLEGIAFVDTLQALDVVDPDGNRAASFYISDSVSSELAGIRQRKREVEALLRLEQTPQLVQERARLCGREEGEEMRIHSCMSEALRPFVPAMLANMQAIADLDLTAEKARIARLYGGVRPELTERELVLKDLANPRIVDLLKKQGKSFTPISITLQPGATVITGANMGGKSVALKTIALNILLVHCGMFPFATEARIPLFDGLHIISEDLESIDRGLSSFGGEMVRFNAVTEQLRQGYHFVLLDEFARGTNPHEGAAIVRAVTRYLNRENAVSVLATHYDHVAEVAAAHYQVAGLKDLDWEKLRGEIRGLAAGDSAQRIVSCMNYGLYPVHSQQDCPRDALHICRLLGMPRAILEDAEKTVSAELEIY